ncbi:MAG: hypothetical protein K9L17_03940 [Clostridiales bacterium]|nr:hypothetical protein [Clostridiales bacterium]MCF8021830.1 hypothetical protein [Clostridiales bacterium]
MADMESINNKLDQASQLLNEAVDLSTELRKEGPGNSKEVSAAWENFLNNFFSYIKTKSKESGQNLMAGISWRKIKP